MRGGIPIVIAGTEGVDMRQYGEENEKRQAIARQSSKSRDRKRQCSQCDTQRNRRELNRLQRFIGNIRRQSSKNRGDAQSGRNNGDQRRSGPGETIYAKPENRRREDANHNVDQISPMLVVYFELVPAKNIKKSAAARDLAAE